MIRNEMRRSDQGARGFTLIEILIVIFIVSIVTTVALLTINRNENKKIESLAGEMTEMMTLAEENAMLQPMILGLRVNEDSFHFATYQESKEQKPIWSPLQDKIFGKHIIPNDVEIKVLVNGETLSNTSEKEKNMPQIIISTSGDITPFTMYIGKKGKKPRHIIVGEANGSIIHKVLS